MPEHIIQMCNEKSKLNPCDYSTFIHVIVIDIRIISKYIRKQIFERVASDIIAKFPATFQQIDSDGVLVSNGLHRLMMKLIDHNCYLNRPHKDAGTSSVLKKKLSTLRLQQKRSSGSINHQPNIDIGQEELEEIQDQINSNVDEYTFEEMEPLLIKMFASQRMFINQTINSNDATTVQKIFEHLPVLAKPEYFIWHYNYLMNNEHNVENIDTFFNLHKEKIVKFAKNSKIQGLKALSNSWDEDFICTLKDAIDIFLIFFKNENNIYKKFPEGTQRSEIFCENGHPIIAEIGKKKINLHLKQFFNNFFYFYRFGRWKGVLHFN